jgi:hypothetical protein
MSCDSKFARKTRTLRYLYLAVLSSHGKQGNLRPVVLRSCGKQGNLRPVVLSSRGKQGNYVLWYYVRAENKNTQISMSCVIKFARKTRTLGYLCHVVLSSHGKQGNLRPVALSSRGKQEHSDIYVMWY